MHAQVLVQIMHEEVFFVPKNLSEQTDNFEPLSSHRSTRELSKPEINLYSLIHFLISDLYYPGKKCFVWACKARVLTGNLLSERLLSRKLSLFFQ